ncbi:hypothetical protein FBG13_06800 [Cobetia marina]|uniref:hypothetical protein n=1 Tax=Cobetia marina TaxID=28258 RepID=UPI0010AE760D|nr:hypothetical protein [Cobetia marina]TKD62681.1 hypothetical protein FBG13_06800 [Cobetia marina]
MTDQQVKPDGTPFQVNDENYKDALELEIVRRIEIMEAPGYQRVPRMNKHDYIGIGVLAVVMLILIIWGGTL